MRIATGDKDERGFVLQNRDGIARITFARLEYVEVVNKTVFFHFIDGAVREVTAALADFEEKLLSGTEFLKVHRSYLVNLNYVQSISEGKMITDNGHIVPIARQRRSQVQDAYMHFLLHKEEVPERGPEKAGHTGGPWRILLVDDEPADRIRWADILRGHGCIVQEASGGEEALRQAVAGVYDCVLLDVALPGEDGFLLCGKLRRLPLFF